MPTIFSLRALLYHQTRLSDSVKYLYFSNQKLPLYTASTLQKRFPSQKANYIHNQSISQSAVEKVKYQLRKLHMQPEPPEYVSSIPYNSWTLTRTRHYIYDVTEVTRDHATPEIRLRLITPSCRLWVSQGDDCQVPDPFWAFYWPGGQALTRYILDNPDVVQGKAVLDVGSGCGASAIAACLGGAASVTANDICPVAAEAIRINASLNEVSMKVDTKNLIGQISDDWDIIFLGDMFYDEDFTNQVTDWLHALSLAGKTIYIGDPGRVYFQKHPVKEHLKMLFSMDLLEHTMQENNGITQGFVWTFT